MGFVKTAAELAATPETADFYDAEMLQIIWETSPATVAQLLPPPLKPARRPIVVAFVANYPRTNFGVVYREAALALRADFGGVEGSYYLAMPVTNDIALILGREVFGYPKKIADISFHREGQEVGGWAERHGVRYFEARANLSGQFNFPDAPAILAEALNFTGGASVSINYNFKFFHAAPSIDRFDYTPRLIREEVGVNPVAIEFGEAEVVLKPSEFDPWSEVEVVRMLGAMYIRGNLSMQPARVVAEADPVAFAPFSQLKIDPF